MQVRVSALSLKPLGAPRGALVHGVDGRPLAQVAVQHREVAEVRGVHQRGAPVAIDVVRRQPARAFDQSKILGCRDD